MTVAKVQRLVRALNEAPAERQYRLRWSCWRRVQQAPARRGHVARRRQRTPAAPTPTAAVIRVPGTALLTAALWARLLLVLPPPTQRGRPQGAARALVAGLSWLMHTGVSWRVIPADYGPWQTLYSRYQRWRRTGTWAQITTVLHAATTPSAGT